MSINLNRRIYVAGHRGLVGSAILRELQRRGYHNIITREHHELELTEQDQVREFFESENIDEVYLAAARVGGIHANNTYPAEFIYTNLAIQNHVIHEAWRNSVQRLLFLGSSCIYPRLAPQPIVESYLMQSALEPTNEPYAMAKLAGIKLCESYNRQYGTDFRSVIPTNLYGTGDNYHPQNSHVIPALIHRFHEAKQQQQEVVTIWGTGTPHREFLHVDDLAQACVHLMNLDRDLYQTHTSPMSSHVNIGTGSDIQIRDLATLIAEVTGFNGRIEFDITQPDGTPRKWLNTQCMQNLGWSPSINLREGLIETYFSYCRERQQGTQRAQSRAFDMASRQRRMLFQGAAPIPPIPPSSPRSHDATQTRPVSH